MRIGNDSSTAWYHKVPASFGQTWQSLWWYQNLTVDVSVEVTRPWHAWVSWYIQIGNKYHDWKKNMTFTRIHHDIKFYIMGLSDRVIISTHLSVDNHVLSAPNLVLGTWNSVRLSHGRSAQIFWRVENAWAFACGKNILRHRVELHPVPRPRASLTSRDRQI